MRRLSSACVLIFTLALFSVAHAEGDAPTGAATPSALTPSALQGFIQQVEKSSLNLAKEPVARQHPDYSTYVLLRALNADLSKQPKQVIRLLENLLPEVKYDGLAERNALGTVNLSVGVVGSYDVWRSMLYVLLGRAYYESGNAQLAVFYLNSVPEDSPFYYTAKLETIWALLKIDQPNSKNLDSVEKEITALNDNFKRLNPAQQSELKLQEAYLNATRGNFDEAIHLAESTQFQGADFNELDSLKWKLLCQAGFDSYVSKAETLGFPRKVDVLKKITSFLDKVNPAYRDAEIAYLAGEVNWHLASVYRVEDVTKYKNESTIALNQSEAWLSPWIERSMKEDRPYLTEDGFFLSIAVLWEQQKFADAIPRLKAVPKFFPQGIYRPDAYQLLADYSYDEGNFKTALYYYQLLAQAGNPEKAAYGVYKAAWSFYNMENKWAALRHLERLLLYYRNDMKEAMDAPGSLSKEVSQDMLIMLGELNRYQDAIKELEIFKFSDTEKPIIRERLATIYKKIGRFEESISVWRFLLRTSSENEQSFFWMKELLSTLLASGKRNLMPSALTEYLKKLPDNKQKHAELQRDMVALLLTVHKEAKKTDDRDIWRATDELYNAFIANYPDTHEGDIWFYGAQRKESLEKKWEAIGWYQKAGEIADYPNRADAGLSVLQILKSISDGHSLKKDVPKGEYIRVAETAKWYTDRFPKTQQRTLAEYLLLDSLFEAKEYEKARAYMAGVLKAEGATQPHQDQFFTHNKSLFKENRWEDGYEFAQVALAALSSDQLKAAGEFVSKVRKTKQEAAFQAAFRFDQAKKFKEAREWYWKAAEANAEFDITIKSWHNLFLTFQFPADQTEFLEKFGHFESQFKPATALNENSQKLVFGIYAHAAKAWDMQGDILKKTDVLVRGLDFYPAFESRENLLWDAVLNYGSFYQLGKMNVELRRLIKDKAKVLTEPFNRLAIARLYFWNQNFGSAWVSLRPLLNPQTASAPVWILLRDLYFQALKEKHAVYANLKEYLSQNAKDLQSISVLQPLWVRVLDPNFDPDKLAEWKTASNRGPASIDSDEPAFAQLKFRVQKVGEVLADFGLNKEEIKKNLTTGAPQVTIAALCAAPKIDAEAVRKLKALTAPAIESPQWPDFLKKINSKISEVAGIMTQEQKICDSQEEQIVYMPPLAKVKPPLCDEMPCFAQTPSSISEAMDLRKGWAQLERDNKKVQGLSKVHEFLKKGAWASAEQVAYNSETVEERSLLLGYIRLAMGDPWNAAPLLVQAGKNPRFAPYVNLFLARSAWRHGYRKIASREAKKIQKDQLLSWQKELYEEMVSELK